MTLRFGITILPEYTWAEAAPRWRGAEQLGFDHAWTYDHIAWAGLPDAPWFGTTATLAAAAVVTSTIRLGTFVTSPNFRHPVPFARDVLALDDISAGRLILGMGAGGDLDNAMMGNADLTAAQRFSRFAEFTELLDRLLTEDHVSADGPWFPARDARTAPGCRQHPRVPFVVAANGPRSLALAARYGQGWVTYGRPGPEQQWWASLAELSARLDDALDRAGVDPAGFERHLNLDSGDRSALRSLDGFTDDVGRAAALGFTDLITHWPRREGPYAADERVLTAVADALPGLR